MTVREIAKLSGVSPATVSRYLNSSENVSQEISQKIESVIKDTPIKARYVDKSKNKKTIAVLLQRLNIDFYYEICNELIEQANKKDINLMFIPKRDVEVTTIESFCKKLNISGIIFLEEDINHDLVEKLNKLSIKVVFCGSESFEDTSVKVHVNDLSAAYSGTKYLLSLGHRKICFLSDYPYSISAGFKRVTGAKRAFEEAGLPFDEHKMVAYSAVNYDEGYNSTKKLIESKKDFTAIFAFGDELAFGAMSALYDAGIRVPEDVSVLGFDDLNIASKIRPALTTVRQPIKDMAKQSLYVFENDEIKNTAIILNHKIVERQSCKSILKGE